MAAHEGVERHGRRSTGEPTAADGVANCNVAGRRRCWYSGICKGPATLQGLPPRGVQIQALRGLHGTVAPPCQALAAGADFGPERALPLVFLFAVALALADALPPPLLPALGVGGPPLQALRQLGDSRVCSCHLQLALFQLQPSILQAQLSLQPQRLRPLVERLDPLRQLPGNRVDLRSSSGSLLFLPLQPLLAVLAPQLSSLTIQSVDGFRDAQPPLRR